MGRLSSLAFIVALLVPVAGSRAAEPAAPRTYSIPCLPSELLRRHDALLQLAAQVKADLAPVPGEAAAATRRRETTRFQVAVLERDTAAAHRALAAVRTTHEAPAAKALAGLFTAPYLEARVAADGDLRAGYHARLTRALAMLPFDETEFVLQALRGQLAGATPDTAVGTARSALDPQVQAGRLPADAAASLLALAVQDELVNSVRTEAVECLDTVIAAHQRDEQPYTPAIGALSPPARGAWFGEARPGRMPVRFAPAILERLNPWCIGVAFSPDGRECFVSVGGATYGATRIVHGRCVAGTWTAFAPPDCLDGFVSTLEAHFSGDGRTLYFTAKKSGEFRRLYAIERRERGWSPPVLAPGPIEGDGDAYRGSRTEDGTWYFGLQLAGMPRICRAIAVRDGAWEIAPLSAPINQQAYDGDPCIAPDGRWIVFNSARSGSVGGSDLFVSFADGRGGWAEPIHLGAEYNSPDDEFGSMLSPDGRQFFFTRHTATRNEIYTVDVSAIDALRPAARR